MPPTDRPAVRGFTITALLLAAPSVAGGHPFLRTRGVVSFAGQQVEITLDVQAEDVLHFGDVRVERDDRVQADEFVAAFRRHRERLASGIAVVDERGTRAVASVVDDAVIMPDGQWLSVDAVEKLRLPVHLRYATTGCPQIMTLRALPESELGRVPWQAALAVRTSGSPQTRTIVVTTGGNAESIELNCSRAAREAPERRCACRIGADVDPDRFREILADVIESGHGLRVRVSVPAAFLETWDSLARAAPDALTAAERTRALAAATARIKDSVTLVVGGRERAGTVESSRFVSAADTGEPESAQSNFWTTRLIVEVRFDVDDKAGAAVLHWSLFNSAVVRARVRLHAVGECRTQDVTTYEPMIWWRSADPQ